MGQLAARCLISVVAVGLPSPATILAAPGNVVLVPSGRLEAIAIGATFPWPVVGGIVR